MRRRSEDILLGRPSLVQRGAKPGLWVVFCVFLVAPTTGLDFHTLEVQNTVQQRPNSNLQFFQTTLFNGQVIFYCESPTLTDQPRQDWIKNTFSAKELTNRDKFCERQYYEHLQWFQDIEKITNRTTEVLQRRRGCVVNGSGIFPLDQWGVNGEPFLTFDPQSQTWMPQTGPATVVAEEWNQPDLRNQIRNHVYGDFGQTACHTSHKLVKRQRQALGQRATDTDIEVRIFTKPIPGSTATYLQCHVTGSDLSGVKVQLTKHNIPLGSGVNLIGPRPNEDRTVQIRAWTQLELKDTEGCQCLVEKDINQTSVTLVQQTLQWSASSEPSKILEHDQRKTVFGLLVCAVVLVLFIVYALTRLNRQKLSNLQCISVDQQVKLYLHLVVPDGAHEKWTKIADSFYGKYEMVLRRTRL